MASKKARRNSAPPYPLVYVEWEDHAGADGWCALSDAIAENDQSCICHSIGWLVAENSKRITIAGSISAVSEVKPKQDVAGQVTIAKALITRREVIKLGGGRRV